MILNNFGLFNQFSQLSCMGGGRFFTETSPTQLLTTNTMGWVSELHSNILKFFFHEKILSVETTVVKHFRKNFLGEFQPETLIEVCFTWFWATLVFSTNRSTWSLESLDVGVGFHRNFTDPTFDDKHDGMGLGAQFQHFEKKIFHEKILSVETTVVKIFEKIFWTNFNLKPW